LPRSIWTIAPTTGLRKYTKAQMPLCLDTVRLQARPLVCCSASRHVKYQQRFRWWIIEQ